MSHLAYGPGSLLRAVRRERPWDPACEGLDVARGQSRSQMRLAIARGISLCASGGCAARARSRAAQLEASAKCSPWDCAIQMPGGEPLSLTRGRACPGMVYHGTHIKGAAAAETGLGTGLKRRDRDCRGAGKAWAGEAWADWCACVCLCVRQCVARTRVIWCASSSATRAVCACAVSTGM